MLREALRSKGKSQAPVPHNNVRGAGRDRGDRVDTALAWDKAVLSCKASWRVEPKTTSGSAVDATQRLSLRIA